MKAFLSPKDLAEAIGVSESSLKRWTDDGRLRAVRTAGGHRRIPMPEAVRYVRETKCQVVRPDMLGLTDAMTAESPEPGAGSLEERFCRALLNDEDAAARGILFSAYLGGMSIAAICDGPIKHAMTVIGDMWKHGPDGILVEHRATDTCIQAITLLRCSLPQAEPTAPLALGCALQGDPYMLPTIAAATVASEVGFRAVNLGADTPYDVLFTAVMKYAPRLVWISASVKPDYDVLTVRLRQIAENPATQDVHVVVGGRAIDLSSPPVCPGVSWSNTMGELASFAKGLVASRG